jgi:hypothetical protein
MARFVEFILVPFAIRRRDGNSFKSAGTFMKCSRDSRPVRKSQLTISAFGLISEVTAGDGCCANRDAVRANFDTFVANEQGTIRPGLYRTVRRRPCGE